MPKSSILFRGSYGLNEVSREENLYYNNKTKFSELSEAVNVDIDNDYSISTRLGNSLLEAGSFSTLHKASESLAYTVMDGNTLCSVTKNGIQQLKTLSTENRRMYFANVDTMRTYYNNGIDIGYISNGVAYDWTVGTYHNPNTIIDFSGPPKYGTFIFYHLGVMYMAVDNVLYYSESIAPNLWDLSSSFFQFSSKIVSLYGIGNSLYVSDSERAYVLLGTTPKDFERKTILNNPIIDGSIQNLVDVNNENTDRIISPYSIICASGNSIYQIDGTEIKNISSKKIKINKVSECASYQNKTHYCCSFK